MQIGVDYSLDYWNENNWEADALKMAKTGVKTVRLTDISWTMLEPLDNQFNFEWLDKLISLFSSNGISVILSTPTSYPPLWLYQKCPYIVQTDKYGNSRQIGEKGNRCINSDVFIGYVKRFLEVYAEKYASHPNVAAWQIDDKIEAYPCTCDNCKDAFKSWLSEKYETLGNINMAFENPYAYTDWNQISPPNTVINPTLELEYKRFTCDCIENFVKMQLNIIRKYNAKARITVNTYVGDNAPDYYKMKGNLNVSLFESYPIKKVSEASSASQAFYLDFMRGLKSNRFWVVNNNKADNIGIAADMHPNMLKGYALQALAHGADTVINYLWKPPLSGRKMFSQGILEHSGMPSRHFDEFSDLCKTASKLSCIYKTKFISKIAVLYSYDSKYALDIQPQAEGFDYTEHLKMLYKAFAKLGANIDVVDEQADLSEYKIVVAPSLFVNNKTAIENIYRFVVGGGTLIMTCRSGVKNESNNCIAESLPTSFRELIGADVIEYSSIGRNELLITDLKGRSYNASKWCDRIKLATATSYANYSEGLYSDETAVSVNQYCNGYAYYIGTVLESGFYAELANKLMKSCEIPRLKGMPEGVEITTRTNDMEDYIFFFNNSDKNAEINLPKPMKSVIDDVEKELISLKPFTAEIVRR